MPSPLLITSKDNPKIKLLKKLGHKKYRDKLGSFVVENLNIISDGLKSEVIFESLFVTKKFIQKNKKEMTTFLKNIGSNHILQNRQFVFAPKNSYNLVAERSEANLQNLQFPQWCSILELVRTAFAACGGEEVSPRKSGKVAEPHE